MDEVPDQGRAPAPGLMPDGPRQGGYGPAVSKSWSRKDHHHPAAGWGAAVSVGKVITRMREPIRGPKATLEMNQTHGFDCPGCAWPDDPNGIKLDFCENGVKHVTWEMNPKRVGREFFAAHTVTELSTWTDFDLEDAGRLVEPMKYDASSDTYVPVSWDEAFTIFGETIRSLDSQSEATYYTSGRLSNEATFLYQLMVRELGTNNLPDCSNMCHEASGRALTASIGTGKGTVDLHDWEQADAIFVLGANVASNAPRMLTSLVEATKRGAQIVHVNPMIEAGATKAIIPHEIGSMARFKATPTGSLNLQVRPGGDLALIRGMAKVVLDRAATRPGILDEEFLAAHATGFEDYKALVERASWDDLVHQSGLSREQITAAAEIYIDADRTIIAWCLGVTQHEHGVDTAREFANLLLLRGNIGRPGAGPSPIRGHSNVQGNRTCGVNHRPPESFLALLDQHCSITSPREHGLDTVRTIEGMRDGSVKVFVGMGGNFVLAAPDTVETAKALANTELTVQVSTKLNRSHLTHGRNALILPCLGRTERDLQSGGEQGVSVEDAMSMVHISHGTRKPASEHLKSELAIIAGMARAAMPDSATRWEWYVEDYDRIRDVMAKVIPIFDGFNTLARQPGGFRLPQPARERQFVTPSGRAEFSLAPLPDVVPTGSSLILGTMRSHDQWNTTIYSANDRYRGVRNLREVIFMNATDMADRGIAEGDLVDVVATSRDGSQRSVRGYRAVAYDLPAGSASGYMPEMNVLIGLADYSTQSDQPLMKNVVVTVAPSHGATPPAQ